MRQTRKKTKMIWQQCIGMAFGMLLGAICGLVIVSYADRCSADAPLHRKILFLAAMLLGMYAAMFFHIIVHEAGHLVFGLLTGYEFSSFRIASFMWLKEDGKLTLKRLSIAGTGGQCLMIPPEMRDGKIPLVLYNLGGSLGNLIVGALFLLGHLLCPAELFLSPLLLIFAAVGFMTAMMNGIPMHLGTVDNDGYNAVALAGNREAVEAFRIQLKMNEQNAKGIRLKDMPVEWFDVPTDEAMKNSMVATRGVLACGRLMDEERFEEADALMAHLLEIDSGIVGLHRSLMMCDRIFVELIGENRSEVIEGMVTKEQRKFMNAMKRLPSVLRTQYVLALLFEKDAAKAERIRGEFEKVAKTYPYAHDVVFERELMAIAEKSGCDRLANAAKHDVM